MVRLKGGSVVPESVEQIKTHQQKVDTDAFRSRYLNFS